jgi:ATP-dependent protease HslVU (ClpYQ) peptidase subunit
VPATKHAKILVGHVHDAMTQLAGEDYEAQIEESEDNLTLTICADTGECMESPFPYTEKGLSRAEAFMMVYDALKIAGVGAIILNDEEDEDDDSDTPFITH